MTAAMPISASDVLQRDKASWFCHIQAPTARFVVWGLMVLRDNGSALQQLLMKQARVVAKINGCKINVGEVGTSGRMSIDRKRRTLALGALLLSAVALGGCSISIADLPLVGTPSDAPSRPKEAGAYLPVNELPPDRDEAAMDPAQRAKIQKELVAARDHQASVTAAKDQTTNSSSNSASK
jgi:hypothetical protein